MCISKIRDELLREHDMLRNQINEVRLAGESWKNGQLREQQARGRLKVLVDALRAHNAHEKEALHGIVLTVDAWGSVRAEIMGEEHLKEHAELLAAITSTSSTAEPDVWCELVSQPLASVLEHMAREERAFLNDEVLRDDSVTIGYEGG